MSATNRSVNLSMMLRATRSAHRLGTALPAATVGLSTADSMLDHCADKHSDRVAIAYLDERITYGDLRRRADQYARFLAAEGVGGGDRVAINFDNRPEFLYAFHGIQRVGAIAALINTNIAGSALAHVVRAAKPKLVIFGSEHVAKLDHLLAELAELEPTSVWVDEEDPGACELPTGVRSLNGELAEQSETRLRPPRTRGRHHCAYIYTSGTTGLPKAAVIPHARFALAGIFGGNALHQVSPGELIYITLPMYHSNGLLVGWSSALATGAGIALRRRFSATAFFDDVRHFDAVSSIYIGELCRYLVNTPIQAGEQDHPLRTLVGNGMRPDVWSTFQARFAVPTIREFYGATEGTGMLVNLAGRPGMVGQLLPGSAIISCDQATGEVRRNTFGLGRRVKPGQVGLFVSPITPVTPFEGYRDATANDAKILRNVFLPGDRYFNSGDLLKLHERRWVSFVDRLGDTYRWKGENVSTTEVADVLNRAPGVSESNVYGVEIAGTDGRAGMAEVRTSADFELEGLAAYTRAELAAYQRPLFIRIKSDAIDVTGTFKHQKVAGRDAGFDPALIDDPLYYLSGDSYLPIDAATFAAIEAGDITPG